MKKFYLPLISLLCLFIIGCNAEMPSTSNNSQTNPSTINKSDASQESEQPNLFDPKTSKVGDTIVGMKIKSIYQGEGSDMGVDFEGETEITGNYRYYPADFQENPAIRNKVCMSNLAPQSEASLPTMSPLDGEWFCFSNTDFAKAQLSNDQGTATVRIKNYKIPAKRGETITAELVSVN